MLVDENVGLELFGYGFQFRVRPVKDANDFFDRNRRIKETFQTFPKDLFRFLIDRDNKRDHLQAVVAVKLDPAIIKAFWAVAVSVLMQSVPRPPFTETQLEQTTGCPTYVGVDAAT
jgi:hypothetical protein